MKTRTSYLLTLLAVAVLLLQSAEAQSVTTNAVGFISDPAGDAYFSGFDLISASVYVYSSGIATFTATFAPGVDLGSAEIEYTLDTDQNPATGYPGRDGANSDSALIGTDYFIDIHGANFQSNAVVSSSSFVTEGTFPVIYSGNTVQVSVPLSALGNDDGLMNFALTTFQQLSLYSSTSISDYAPNRGQAVGVVAPVGTVVGSGTAIRSMPPSFTSGTAFTVSIAVTPDMSIHSNTVQDLPPADWAVSNISDGGTYDSTSGMIHWGPFTGSTSRTLTYEVTPMPTLGPAASFSGSAMFDTLTVPITGQTSIVPGSPISSGIPAPHWTLPSITGSNINSTNYAGKVVLLNFWATWCGPCVAEIPDLISLQQKYNSDGLEVVGISVDDNGSTPPTALLQSFVSANQINYPIVMSRPNGLNVESAYGGISAIPQTFLIDRQNRIVQTFIGSQSFATYEQAARPLLYANLALNASVSQGSLHLYWPLTQAQSTLEATSDPRSGVWTVVQTNFQSDSSHMYIDLPSRTVKQFFRLKSH
ncbi:MAG TPA: redoxin family protein [Verrucomicrobiae bacterium]|jgi:thiol-disulfide isomerase/thioredoxin|nr:redoxin family protein [Verrucomicrobiae bacterium]